MAASGSLSQFFDEPSPENTSLFDSLSGWSQIKNLKPGSSSFIEIFGELHFHEEPQETPPRLPARCETNGSRKPPLDPPPGAATNQQSSDSLQLCTEGLGFESCGGVEDLMKEEDPDNWTGDEMPKGHLGSSPEEDGDLKTSAEVKTRTNGKGFPPPISTIGRSGKPWMCFLPYRDEGRFVLREVRIPPQEFLQASRKDGRLKLQLVQQDEGDNGQLRDEREQADGGDTDDG